MSDDNFTIGQVIEIGILGVVLEVLWCGFWYVIGYIIDKIVS